MKDLLYLGIETSGRIASAALCDEGGIIGESVLKTSLTHSQVIMPMVKKLLEDCGTDVREVDRFAVAVGPGSYTGLRIGIAAVKGMCMAVDGKCIGISTLEELAYNLSASDAVVIAALKARRDVVYSGAFRVSFGRVERLAEDRVRSLDELRTFAAKDGRRILVAGDCCDELMQECFSGMSHVCAAPVKDRLQKASSLCFAAIEREAKAPGAAVSADELQAAYLQETKAQKDRAHMGKEPS